MIDVTTTLKKHHNVVSELSRGSQKLVVVVCDDCGKIRDIKFREYRDLCVQCVHKLPEVRAKKSKSMRGKNTGPHTEEHNRNISEGQMGAKNHNYGKPMSPEARAKNSISHTGLHASDETKQTMSNVRKGVPKSDETKARMKAHALSPDGRKRRSVHMTDRYSTPEGRERQSANLQGQDYDAGGWSGFTDKSRPHLLPIHACIKINEWFPGCEGHHLSKSLVVFVPEELHKHIDHNLSTGFGMAEMNALALQFAF